MKKLLLLLIMMVLHLFAYGAERVEIGALYYNTNEETKEAEVTSGNVPYSFSSISIPEKVSYNGIEYLVTNICSGTFYGCNNLKSISIPNSVTSIGADGQYAQGAFWGCTSLTSIIIPNSVISIGRHSFTGCKNLVSISIPMSVKHIGYSAFSETAWYDAQPDGLIYAGKVAYSYKGTMPGGTDLTIEDGSESISPGAFMNCTGLLSITLPSSLKEIGGEYNPWGGFYAGAFTGCSSLISVTIPNSVTCIGDGAFSGCSSLISIKTPDNLTTIGDEAFKDCTVLTSINLSNNITNIGIDAFNGCSSLLSLTIPNKVTRIERGTFQNCISLTNVIIPNSVKSIGGVKWSYSTKDSGAFSGCCSLSSITIPESVTTIEACAFRYCSGLTSIIIPQNVTSVGKYAFQGCTGLSSIDLPNTEIQIGIDAFEGCNSLTSIVIPDGIKTLEAGIFMNCRKLKSVSLPNSVIKISSLADESKIHGAFSGCYSLESIILSENITAIESNTFMGCNKLQSITIPNSVTIIGDNAFQDCSSLTSLSIPNKVASIGEQAFYGCRGLIAIEFSEGIISLKNCSFAQCGNLRNIIIPSSMEAIYQNAFQGCNQLEYVKVLPTKPPFLFDNSFSNYSVPLKVPKGCKEVYLTAQGWKNFTNISDVDKYKLTYVVDDEDYKSYEIEEGASITPEPAPTKEGYTFSGWSEIPETMPAHDVTVSGSFSINKYKLTYTVDGAEYKTYEVEFGATITPEAEPTKEGYTFSGWSEIPETMPAHDVTVTGTFSINKYKLTYTVDGAEYKTYEVEFGATITPEAEPTKEGYTFSGWSEIPEIMPAHDVTVTGTFTINKYKLTYIVDGTEYKTYEIEYGAAITPEAEPTKEGYTFSEWSEIPSTMPPYDVTVTGTFNINSYKLTYMIDDKVYKEMMYEYGATIIPEPQPEGDYDTFEWIDLPQTMPAHDVVVYASYTSGIIEVLMASQQNLRIYSPNGKKLNKLQKGINIVFLDDGTVKKVIMK